MRIKWRRVAFWVLLFWLVYTWPTEGEEKPILLMVYPKLAVASEFQRTTIRVTWRIQKHPDNRWWAFTYRSDNGDEGLSQGPMDGEKSQVIYPVCILENSRPCFREVAPGVYWFMVCVYRIAGRKVVRFCDTKTLEVKGR